MRVLVTGAFGYIGLALIRRLANEHTVSAWGRPPRNRDAMAFVPVGIEIIEGDLRERLRGRDFGAVIHLVGGGGPKRCAADPVSAVRSLTDIATASDLVGGRRIIASSIYVYGPRDRPSTETDPTEPSELYGALKEASGAHAHCSLRLASVYGIGAPIDLGRDSAVDRFARAAATGGEMFVYGDGSRIVDYVHIEDVVEAFALSLAPRGDPAFNIGGGAPESLLAIAERCLAIGRERGTEPRLRRVSATERGESRCLDISLAERRLGWKPRVPFDRGLRELVEFYATHGARS